MASAEPRSMTHIGTSGIRFTRDDPEAVLGKGGFGIVFKGWMNEREVAIKRIFLENSVGEEREVELQRELDHENVLKILQVEKDDNFRYIVLELCAGTLEHFINKEYKGPAMPSDVDVLNQIACGVQYIHSKKLIHRDIKPDNILISYGSPVVMKVSDFGLSKRTSSRGTCSISGIMGTRNWMAPEMLNLNPEELEKERGSVQSDIFPLGLVFFYFIKRGIHLFGENANLIPANIVQKKPVNLKELSKEHFAYGLIIKMIRHNKKQGIALTEVIEILENISKYQFKAIERSFPQLSGWSLSRFHPTDPVLAFDSFESPSVIILEGENGSVPFSNWEIQQKFKLKTQSIFNKIRFLPSISALEWHVTGTQLAAGCSDGTVIVWSYPSGHALFEEKKHSKEVSLIVWNPFRQDVLATGKLPWKKLLFWNSRRENGDAKKANPFLTMERQVTIWSVAWISANQIAIGLDEGKIEICEMDDDKGSSQVVKQFKHRDGWDRQITGLEWNERTKYLASSSEDDKWIKIWSMDSDQPVHSLQLDYIGCERFAWRRNVKTDDGRGIDGERKDKENFFVACGLSDTSVVIWNPLEEDESNRKRTLLQKHSRSVASMSYSPDGRFLASMGGELIIWSTDETWLPVFTCQSDASCLSWMSSTSSSVSAYKLAVESNDKVLVIEESFTE